jgi:hypothetical protein
MNHEKIHAYILYNRRNPIINPSYDYNILDLIPVTINKNLDIKTIEPLNIFKNDNDVDKILSDADNNYEIVNYKFEGSRSIYVTPYDTMLLL